MSNPFVVNGAHWALKKKDLPKLCKGPFDYGVSVWRGPHPSPEFKGIMVWWTKRYDLSISNMLKAVYGTGLAELIPKDPQWPK